MRRIVVCVIFYVLLMFLFSNSSTFIITNDNKQTNKSEWVYKDKSGKLVYKETATGDRIMDFSFAGYMGGGVSLPQVSPKIIIKPSGGDDSQPIQAAIDSVAKLEIHNGFRGAVLLAPGLFICSEMIKISASGIVLRGSGSGLKGTVRSTLRMAGGRHRAFILGKDNSHSLPVKPEHPEQNIKTFITDSYIPSGTAVINVEESGGLKVGDKIIIKRPVTESWIRFMQMDGLVRNGKKQTWLSTNRENLFERKITAIHGNQLTINIPFSDSFNALHLAASDISVTKVLQDTNEIRQIGVENLHIECPPLETDYAHAPFSAFMITASDSWVRDIFCDETINTMVIRGQRITIKEVVVKHTFPNLGASKPADFSIEGSQILIDRCEANGSNTYFVWTGSLVNGPNVVLNCRFFGYGNRIQPHQRWSTGLLVDNCKIVQGGIDFMNRGVMGSGHGWSMGWGVIWNSIAKTYVVQNPPGAINWVIGSIGTRVPTPQPFDESPDLPEGVFDTHNRHVMPGSLYLAQLSERSGEQAVKNSGYDSENDTVLFDYGNLQEKEFARTIDDVFGPDLAEYRPVNSSNIRHRDPVFGAERALDGNPDTFWATDDTVKKAEIIIDFEGAQVINTVEIREAGGFESRVQFYRIEGQYNSDWKILSEGTIIDGNKIHQFPEIKIWKLRLVILSSEKYPAIKKLSAYLDESRLPGKN